MHNILIEIISEQYKHQLYMWQ